MIEGDDKVRAQKCLAELQEVNKKFNCSLTPEFIFSGGKVMDRLKIKGNDKISIQAYSQAIGKIFDAYDCIAVAKLKFADGQIADSVTIIPKPRGGETVGR